MKRKVRATKVKPQLKVKPKIEPPAPKIITKVETPAPKRKAKSAYVNCLITGKKHYIYGPALARKIAKFGSLQDFEKHFISTKAKKLLKEGLSQQEVREKLKVKQELPEVDDQILYRNKIKKVNKRVKKEETGSYIDSEVYKVKKLNEMRTFNKWASFKAYVEWLTGNDTCHRPDIILHEHHCKSCEYHEFCLCSSKVLLRR